MLQRLFFLTFTAGALALQTQAQNWTWAETAGGNLFDEAYGSHLDAAGNMYMSGYYSSNSINFGNGVDLSLDAITDSFIVKYNGAPKSIAF